MFSTPILLICFNRPNHVSRVLAEIKKQQPKSLFVFRDGPRSGNAEDVEKCQRICETISSMVDWPCELKTFYAEKNLGCGMGPKTALDWFFPQVEMGIVMEDDCLPNPDFFEYCQELLERYKDVQEVRMINTTLYNSRWQCKYSYGFSRYMVSGAWASWSRAWVKYDLDLTNIKPRRFYKQCRKMFYERAEADWWYFKLLEIQRDKNPKSYWDYQKQILMLSQQSVTIHPAKNLISNIGFDAEGTHTLDNKCGMGDRQTFPIMPLNHPPAITIDKKQDSYCFAKAHNAGFIKDFMHRTYLLMYWAGCFWQKFLNLYKSFKGKN